MEFCIRLTARILLQWLLPLWVLESKTRMTCDPEQGLSNLDHLADIRQHPERGSFLVYSF
jgi:hypothetical protein